MGVPKNGWFILKNPMKMEDTVLILMILSALSWPKGRTVGASRVDLRRMPM